MFIEAEGNLRQVDTSGDRGYLKVQPGRYLLISGDPQSSEGVSVIPLAVPPQGVVQHP